MVLKVKNRGNSNKRELISFCYKNPSKESKTCYRLLMFYSGVLFYHKFRYLSLNFELCKYKNSPKKSEIRSFTWHNREEHVFFNKLIYLRILNDGVVQKEKLKNNLNRSEKLKKVYVFQKRTKKTIQKKTFFNDFLTKRTIF